MVGVPGSSGAGVTLDCLREMNTSSSAELSFRAGDAGTLKPLSDRTKRLDGRSEELLIWLGRRTNGLAFSGDRLWTLLLLLLLCFEGDDAGEALLVWRLNGDVRPMAAERRFGFGCMVVIVGGRLAVSRAKAFVSD